MKIRGAGWAAFTPTLVPIFDVRVAPVLYWKVCKKKFASLLGFPISGGDPRVTKLTREIQGLPKTRYIANYKI